MLKRGSCSNLLGDTSALGHVVSPILLGHLLLAFSLLHFFIVRILIGSLCFGLHILLLSVESISHLLLSQLLKGLGWHVVTWSENLVFVLLSKVNHLVDGVLVDIHSLVGVLVRVDNAATHVGLIGGAHQVGYFLKALLLKKLTGLEKETNYILTVMVCSCKGAMLPGSGLALARWFATI